MPPKASPRVRTSYGANGLTGKPRHAIASVNSRMFQTRANTGILMSFRSGLRINRAKGSGEPLGLQGLNKSRDCEGACPSRGLCTNELSSEIGCT